MTARVQEFDGVRELSMEEVEAVAGGPWGAIARAIGHVGKVARDTAIGQALIEANDADWGPDPSMEEIRSLRQA